MDLHSFITSERCILGNLRASSKKQALQDVAKRAAELTGLPGRAVLDVILERERLGTTGLGGSVAIPHGKLAELDRVYGVFARLERPVPFDSVDDLPVDLVFLLLAPEDAGAEHLKALAKVSRILRDRPLCEKIRGSDTAEAIYALLMDREASRAA